MEGQGAQQTQMGALIAEALELSEQQSAEQLGAIDYILEMGFFEHEVLRRLLPIDSIREKLPQLPHFPDVLARGRRLRRRVLELLREILCSEKEIWKLSRAMIEEAIGEAAHEAAEAIATALVGVGILARIAALVASGIVKFLMAKGLQLTCKTLGDYLESLPADW
jgi:hypothetical protein